MNTRIDQDHFPNLYSFITYRPERFGALLFNSLTGRELELDRTEADVVRSFDGSLSLAEISASYGQSHLIPVFEADQAVTAVCQKLDLIQALKVHPIRQTAAPGKPLPDLGDPLSGPYYTAPKSAVWDITYLCNLKCPHCLTASGSPRAGELSTREAFRLIDNLAAAKLLTLSLSGGEPFLRKDLPELIRYATDHNIRTDIASNGVAMDETILAQLKDLPLFHIQISLDGIGAKHDAFRGMPGAYSAILENIKRLKQQGISVSISTTATSENYRDIPELIDLAYELGCSAYKAIPFLPAGRGATNAYLKLSVDNYLAFSQMLLDKAEEYKGKLDISTETTFSFLLTENEPHGCSDGMMGCSAAYDTLSIGSDATAYPCPFFQTIPLGNLLEVPLTELWKNSPILGELRNVSKPDLDEPCQNCGYAPDLCRGGCRASAYLNSGSVTGCDPLCPKYRDA